MSTSARNDVRGYGRDPRPTSVAALLEGSPFIGYGYAYPHKTAYRTLERPRPLAQVWADQDRQRLFLYVHVPFCAVRCGFCNLFTQKHPPAELPQRWLDTLATQIDVVGEALPDARFARWAIGGGTPTLLEAEQLERVFVELERRWPINFAAAPGSVETSPETCTDERLAVLEARGTERISIGIQSFFTDELRALGRPQAVSLGEQALDRIRARRFATLNIDLIYGIAGQTPASFVAAIDRALAWAPEQLYLYPLYQRPLTGLGRHGRSWDDQRLACLRAGRDHLRTLGYQQVSMRMFQSERGRFASDPLRVRPADGSDLDLRCAPVPKPGPSASGPVYCCQADGMIGLGVGARSYTRGLHYSEDWAVGSAGIREIVADWIDRPRAQLGEARYGIMLDEQEQRRRWLIQSLLQIDGLSLPDYQTRFGSEANADFSELAELLEHGLLLADGERLRPSDRGLEWADAIAPWLYSDSVRAASRDFELR